MHIQISVVVVVVAGLRMFVCVGVCACVRARVERKVCFRRCLSDKGGGNPRTDQDTRRQEAWE